MQETATLSEEDSKELDKLVEYGVFGDKSEAINISIKFLVKKETIKREDLTNGMAVVNSFLMDNLGDLPFASQPIIIQHNDKKGYMFPVKTRIGWDRTILLGFVCVDSVTFEIIPELSDSAEKLNKVCDQIEKEFELSLL